MELKLPAMFDSPRAAAPRDGEIAALAAWLGVSARAARACCARLRTVATALDAANDGPDLPPLTRWQTALRLSARLLTVEGEGAVAGAASRLLVRLDGEARAVADPQLRTLVTRCLTERCVLAVTYWDVEAGDWAPRLIEPLSLSNVDGHWTVLAFCRTRSDLRSFRFDRIGTASATEARYEPRPSLSLERFLHRQKKLSRPRLVG